MTTSFLLIRPGRISFTNLRRLALLTLLALSPFVPIYYFSAAYARKDIDNPAARNGAQQQIASCERCKPPTKQIIYASLFDLPEASGSEIVLNCRSPREIDITPTFYTIDGTPVVGDVIRLKPAEIRFVDTKSLIPDGERNRHRWGGLSFSYTGNFMEAWAQLTLHGAHGGSADVLFAVLEQSRSNTAEAVWWVPPGGESLIALGNSSDQPIRASMLLSNGDSKVVDIAPFATETVRLRPGNSDLLSSARGKSESVSINYAGPSGSLIPTGFVNSNDGRFTSMVRFYDTQNVVQQNLYANNLRLKDTVPHMVLRNTSASPIVASPRFLTASGMEADVVKVPGVRLAPYEAREVNLRPLIAAASKRGGLESVSVQVLNSGETGSLIGALYSNNTETGVVYEVPLRDSGPRRASTGAYPVRLDDDYTTVLSITNVDEKPGRFMFQINYEGGAYVLEYIDVRGGETKTYDIRKLRDEQTPDRDGHPLPKSMATGQIRWSVRGPQRLIGRAEVVSRKDGISSSYSCQTCCPTGFRSGWLSPIQASVLAGLTTQYTAKELSEDCYGNEFGVHTVATVNDWGSDNTSIASADSGGVATGLAAGTTNIWAKWTVYNYDIDNDGPVTCIETEEEVTRSAPVKVSRLRVRVPNAPVANDTQESISAGIVAGEQFQMIVDAVDDAGNVDAGISQSVSVSTSRTLDATESGLPSTITLSNGTYINSTVKLNRVNNTDPGTTFRFATAGVEFVDFSLYTYFSVIATKEGLVGGTTACSHVITSNDQFVALPSTGLCNTGVIVRNGGGGTGISTTVRDVGPWYPHPTATTGNPCAGGNDPYWNTGGVPRTETVTCDSNNAGIDLADGTFSSLGLTNPTRILWRFN